MKTVDKTKTYQIKTFGDPNLNHAAMEQAKKLGYRQYGEVSELADYVMLYTDGDYLTIHGTPCKATNSVSLTIEELFAFELEPEVVEIGMSEAMDLIREAKGVEGKIKIKED